ncbi:hypothetical protein VP01_3183g1, partial [Puccinia sorghi]
VWTPWETPGESQRGLQDHNMIKEDHLSTGKRQQQRCRVRVKNPMDTIFPKAPTGLPPNFYNAEWFNNKLPAQKQNLAKINTVAFIPNPIISLTSKSQADEKLSNEKISQNAEDESDDDESVDHEEVDSDYGQSIDLNNTDGSKEDDEDDEYEEEEDFEVEEGDDGGEAHEVSYINRLGGDDEEMEDGEINMENFGEGTFSGGLTAGKWDKWQ